MIEGFSSLELGALAGLVFLAGAVDALAGGGGLITLPAYLAAGLPPALLLGTNKLSSTLGTVASTLRYALNLKIDRQALPWMILASMAGSALGAGLSLLLDPAWLKALLLAALPLIAYAVLRKRDFGSEDRSGEFTPSERLKRSLAVSFPIGAYDGFFGPGTGTFFALGLSRVCRQDLLRATAHAKILNLVSNAAALAAFLWAGRVHVTLGLAMGVAGVGGHYLGSHLGLKQGARAIRPVIALVCAGLFLKLLLDVIGK
ncbi:MAG: TSUP family transporter [Elusimicrobiota bacterium]